jgi:hypothetical protein
MHSMSSMPRARSHSAASFQLATPRVLRVVGDGFGGVEVFWMILLRTFLAAMIEPDVIAPFAIIAFPKQMARGAAAKFGSAAGGEIW